MWELVARSLEASTIFLFAALGELIDQRSGVLNVGLEGLMLFGGTAAFITAQTTGSHALGFLAGLTLGGLLGLGHGFFSITLRGDQVVSGMGLWILSFGLTTYLGSPYTGPLGLGRIPSLWGLSPFFPLGVALVAITWLLLFRTGLGLAIRSAGENPAAAEASGIPVTSIRFLCVALGGMLAGLSGATYTLSYNPVWNYNFLMGWGFVSLALVFFSMWNPWILLAGASLFWNIWRPSPTAGPVPPGGASPGVGGGVPLAIPPPDPLLLPPP